MLAASNIGNPQKDPPDGARDAEFLLLPALRRGAHGHGLVVGSWGRGGVGLGLGRHVGQGLGLLLGPRARLVDVDGSVGVEVGLAGGGVDDEGAGREALPACDRKKDLARLRRGIHRDALQANISPALARQEQKRQRTAGSGGGGQEGSSEERPRRGEGRGRGEAMPAGEAAPSEAGEACPVEETPPKLPALWEPALRREEAAGRRECEERGRQGWPGPEGRRGRA